MWQFRVFRARREYEALAVVPQQVRQTEDATKAMTAARERESQEAADRRFMRLSALAGMVGAATGIAALVVTLLR